MITHIECIEIYVANLPLAKHFYATVFQFSPIASMQREDCFSVLMQHHEILLMLTSTTSSKNAISDFINIHGDGVKNIIFGVTDIEQQFKSAIQHGAQAIVKPTCHEIDGEKIMTAMVSAFGETTHSFIQRSIPNSIKLPFFQFDHPTKPSNQPVFDSIDHVAICVPQGELSKWIEYYQKAYHLHLTHEEYVITENTGMDSKAISSANQKIKMVFAEPIKQKKASQVTEFLNHGGPGVQHMAFSTTNILTAAHFLKQAGLELLSIPPAYYEIQQNKFKHCDYDFNLLREHSILVDNHEETFLYQLFSKPISTKPTLFFEIIQRNGFNGFGRNNIKALFQAVEQEQFKRASGKSTSDQNGLP